MRARYPATRRGAELHKPCALATGRGSERGNAVEDFTRMPAEWRIGSPVIEDAWYDAAHTERKQWPSVTKPRWGSNAGTIGIRRYRDKDIIDAKMGIDEQAFLGLHRR